MFPDIRLMIAAVAASVVALSCGFGVFAALRVNHEPLARLPAATAPLQLVPDTVAASGIPSARPVPVAEPLIADRIMDAPAREIARDDGGEPPSAPPAAEPKAAASAVEEKTEAAEQPADPPATSVAALTADDHAPAAAAPESPPAEAADSAGAPISPPHAEVAEIRDEAKPEESAETTGGPAPAATPSVALLDPPADQAAPAERAASPIVVAPPSAESDAAGAIPTTAKKIARKKNSTTHVAAKTHRKQHTRVAARSNTRDSMLLQPHFVSAPEAFRQTARVRHAKVASKKMANRSSPVGGPFVTTPGR
jgi:hypothetical protein